jgi:hypothetical protein
MTSALWVATSGMPVSALLAAIPPACRRPIDAPAQVRPGADEVVLESPVWPAAGATHFVPAFAVQASTPFSARLELSVRSDGAWSPWVGSVSLGPTAFDPLPSVEALDVDIDVFRTRAPVEVVRLRVRLRAPEPAALAARPWMLSLSSADGATAVTTPPTSARGVQIDVPARSQMEADAAIASRICSPTCVAMLLDFWRRPVPLADLAAEIFHAGTDLYGVWPAAILAAGRRGLAGYLLKFPDWESAHWCLARGLPIVASVRYAAGELAGAAAAETPGHLLVLTGWDGDDVLVNDPAAATPATVARRYRREELERVWLGRTGVGYVIFDIGGPDMAPKPPTHSSPPGEAGVLL